MIAHFIFVLAVLGTEVSCAQYTKCPRMYDSEDFEIDGDNDPADPEEPMFGMPTEPAAHSEENQLGLESANEHRLRQAFGKFGRSTAATATEIFKVQSDVDYIKMQNKRFALVRWQLQVLFLKKKGYLASGKIQLAAKGSSPARAILNWRTAAALNPRRMRKRWPKDQDVDHIFSLSANYLVSSRSDKRAKDIQVQFSNGLRIQMPLKVFNLHPLSVDMLAGFKAGQKERLALKNQASREAMTRAQISSLARSMQRNSRSSSPGAEEADEEDIVETKAKASLSNFLDHSLERPRAKAKEEAVSTDEEESDEEDNASTQFAEAMKVLAGCKKKEAAAENLSKEEDTESDDTGSDEDAEPAASTKAKTKPSKVGSRGARRAGQRLPDAKNNTASAAPKKKSRTRRKELEDEAAADFEFEEMMCDTANAGRAEADKAMVERKGDDGTNG